MTTGTWTTGSDANTASGFPLCRFHSGKTWVGGDGRTITGRVSRKLKWNTYSMSHRAFRSFGDPRKGLVFDGVSNVQVNNISWREAVAWNLNDTDGLVAGKNKFLALYTTGDEYKLQEKLLARVKGHSFNAGVSLAEVDKLSKGVVSTVKQLGFGLRDLALGRYQNFARRFGTYPPSKDVVRKLRTSDISGRFLEMRYAWTPAIQDAFEAAKAFEALSNGPRQVTVRASRMKQGVGYTPGNYNFKRAYGWQVRRTYTYEAYEEMAAFRQMGLGNPASILWERLPYSFVIDWFIPIGTYLELIGQIPFLKGRFMRTDSYLEQYDGGWARNGPYIGSLVGGHGIVTGFHFWMERTLPASLSVPVPSLRVAGSVQGKRVQNALALAHQLFISAVNFGFGKPSLRRGRIKFDDYGVSNTLVERLARF